MTVTGAFGTLAFLNPWILAGLLFLPVLWFLLRVTPPAPRRMIFPPARLMAGLLPEERTPSHTPWWILLLRLFTAALIIAALARPVLNPADSLPGQGPVRIVVDNGWAAAQNWPPILETARSIVDRAGRARREIFIMTTAPEPGKKDPLLQGPMTEGQADALLNGLAPQPWPADYEASSALIQNAAPEGGVHSFWLSHGIKDGKAAGKLLQTLQNQGGLSVFLPEDSALPLLLRPSRETATELKVLIDAPATLAANVPAGVEALSADGHVIDIKTVKLLPKALPEIVALDIPDNLRNQIGRVRLSGRQGAGATLLMDDQSKRRTVGIAAATDKAQNAPLIEASYYIRRALEPYADIIAGGIPELVSRKADVIILPDVGAMPADELNTLESWVKKGGLLLRFAGPNMTQGENFLTPVPLRSGGGRAMGGALTWETPEKLAPFPPTSPYSGLPVPEDVTVARQILADPVEGMEQKTWATLADGTPLITADSLENGMMVLVHTTATPEWSDLVLSGIYVQILRRTIGLAGSHAVFDSETSANSALQPILTLDGFGAAVQPPASALPIPAESADTFIPDSSHPPGIYGHAGYQTAINLGARLGKIESFGALPPGVENLLYGMQEERDLMPSLLLAALVLFMTDWLIMMILQGGWRFFARRAAAASLALFLATSPLPVRAESEADAVRYAGDLYLAYIQTGNMSVDSVARRGLEGLKEVLDNRTSVEPAGIVALDPEADELIFFPMIYWPIAPEQQKLSGKALQKIQNYLDHGGTLLIDTRDQGSTPDAGGAFSGGANASVLRKLLGSLNVPPLVSMEKNHVLLKSFYLMRRTPGRFDGGALWVEEDSVSGKGGVSGIIIGSNDWAALWAAAADDGANVFGYQGDQELAMRFGVNVMMYALTGNYKADQVHMPHILERLGQ